MIIYTNDTQCLYGICHNLFNVVVPQCQGFIIDNLGKLHALFHEFNEYYLMPLFMPRNRATVKVLHGVCITWTCYEYSHVRDRISGSFVVPKFTYTCSTLLCVPSKLINDTPTLIDDSFALASQYDDHHPSRMQVK